MSIRSETGRGPAVELKAIGPPLRGGDEPENRRGPQEHTTAGPEKQPWSLFTVCVGPDLLQSAFTRWCLMEDILHKLGVPKTP